MSHIGKVKLIFSTDFNVYMIMTMGYLPLNRNMTHKFTQLLVKILLNVKLPSVSKICLVFVFQIFLARYNFVAHGNCHIQQYITLYMQQFNIQ